MGFFFFVFSNWGPRGSYLLVARAFCFLLHVLASFLSSVHVDLSSVPVFFLLLREVGKTSRFPRLFQIRINRRDTVVLWCLPSTCHSENPAGKSAEVMRVRCPSEPRQKAPFFLMDVTRSSWCTWWSTSGSSFFSCGTSYSYNLLFNDRSKSIICIDYISLYGYILEYLPYW